MIADLIEAMARAISAKPDHLARAIAATCLATIREQRPDVAALLDGEAVAVPKEPTAAMTDQIWLAAQLQNANSQYRAMLAASPYAQKEPKA